MIYTGKTDIGMRRPVNQDYFICATVWDGRATLLCLCDGMGGHKAGEIASRKACAVFCDSVAATPPISADPNTLAEEIRYKLCDSVRLANSHIYKLSEANEDCKGMGTTIVAALIYQNKLYGLNVGDSRMYVLTKRETKQLSIDHSFVQYLLDQHKITPEEAKYYPRKNIITRAVGISEKVNPSYFNISLSMWNHGYILLCSDGLTNYASDKTIHDILFGDVQAQTPELRLSKKVDQLIAYANSNGGNDNITAVAAEF